MQDGSFDLAIGIGGAAGQGIATPGNILARSFVRRGLHFYAYNAHQSIIRGGHILLTARVSNRPITTHGDKLDLLVCLNQDTMDRHLSLMGPGSRVIFNSDNIEAGEAGDGVVLCPVPVGDLTEHDPNKLVQNTTALGVIMWLLGLPFSVLEETIKLQFRSKGDKVIDENLRMARAAYEHAAAGFEPFPEPMPEGDKPLAMWAGNDAIAMGGAAAGVRFYAAYPMSPASGILHWMARNARDLGIMVRQGEDEIGVANMVIGAAHTGCRAMCATSGGGFALMTEAIGSAAMMEIPAVFINVMRAGPSTGVPTKTEQADLWQVLGASQGDYERVVVAPLDALDAYDTMPELFNVVDRCQCPGLMISDLLLSEGTFSVDPDSIDLHPEIERGALLTEGRPAENGGLADPATREGSGYKRYELTEDGVSPRAIPGLEGYVHVVATDEHDEDGVLISDEFTNPHKRRAMVEKRARKVADLGARLGAPRLEGPEDADVTLVGWGSTWGVMREAREQLAAEGISANQLSIKWIVPLHVDEITGILSAAKRWLIVENNHSGQFARYLRGETGLQADGHIRKYDGEPFMPHHVVAGVRDHLRGRVEEGVFVPFQEVMV